MNEEEYKSAVKHERNKLGYFISRNGCVAFLGLALAYGLYNYNNFIGNDFLEQVRETPHTLKAIKEISEKYISILDKMQNIQNAMIATGLASGIGLILGWGIPISNYKSKKKSLEKDLAESSLE